MVNGEGGIGKTTLAARYYKHYENEYQYLAWVFAENSIQEALLTLADSLKIKFPETATQKQRFKILLTKLRNLKAPCLLVIDNANEFDDLNSNEQLFSSLSNFHILITSRVNNFSSANSIAIEALKPEQLIELFSYHYPKYKKDEDHILLGIIKAVGNNTLVIELLAKTLKQINLLGNYSLNQLLKDIQEKGLLQLETKEINTGYQNYKGVKPETIIAAMYDLEQLNEKERKIMSAFAVLPAELIAFKLIEKMLSGIEKLDDNILNLANKGWLTFNEENTTFKTSPVIQEVCRNKNELIKDDLELLVKNLIDLLEYEGGVGHFKNVDYKTAALLSYYGSFLSNYYIVSGSQILFERIGNYHKTTGNLQFALEFFEKYSSLTKKMFDEAPHNENLKNSLGISYERVGDIHTSLGNLPQALMFFEQYNKLELELFEAFPDNVGFKNVLAISYEKLGETHASLGNLQQVLSFFEQYNKLELELFEAFPDNVGFKNGLAISYEKLGQTHASLGNLQQALSFFEQNNKLELELFEAFPDNVGFKNVLAISYEKLGQTHASLGNLPQALMFFEQYNKLELELFEAFPDNVGFKNVLAISYEKLGQTHASLGNLQQALSFFEKQTVLFEQLFEAFPDNVVFKNGLAISYCKLAQTAERFGDNKQAIQYFEKAKSLWVALNTQFPAYVQFGKFLAMVNSDIERVSN